MAIYAARLYLLLSHREIDFVAKKKSLREKG